MMERERMGKKKEKGKKKTHSSVPFIILFISFSFWPSKDLVMQESLELLETSRKQ